MFKFENLNKMKSQLRSRTSDCRGLKLIKYIACFFDIMLLSQYRAEKNIKYFISLLKMHTFKRPKKENFNFLRFQALTLHDRL